MDSTQYPIRVYYTNSAGLPKAQEALGHAEASWQIQVEQMGFHASSTEDATGDIYPGFRLYLDPDGMYDHTEPIGNNPNTPWTDCTTRVVIVTLTPANYFELVIYHNMNHALKMADDCGEGSFALESTGGAVTALIWPNESLFREYFLPVFQDYPHHGLDCIFFDSDRGYFHYGSSLFQIFLEDHYGSYDGTLLSSIWRASRQNGTVSVGGAGVSMDVPNAPHLFDAIETVLDGPTLGEVYTRFARWRYFVGLRDDGEHFRDGGLWAGAELALDAEWVLDDLPLSLEAPVHQPNAYGSVYLALDLDSMDDEHGVRFAFQADPTVAFSVDVLLVRPTGTADVRTVLLDSQNTGELTLEDLTDYEQAVFIVNNLGDGTHSPDAPECSVGASFVYDLERVATSVPPVVTSVDPTELDMGMDHHLWVYGAGFLEGAQVALSGSGVGVSAVTRVNDTTLSVDITVAPDAASGFRSLTVTNPNTLSGTLPDAVHLIAESEEEEPGCGCATPAGGNAPGLLLWALVLVFALRRRR